MTGLVLPNWVYPPRSLIHVRDTGAIERRNPLPVGTYWVDVFNFENGEQQIPAFESWLTQNRAIVKVIATEGFTGEASNVTKRNWYLFKVTGGPGGQFLPQWDGPGLPTIATPDIHSSQDTIREPDVQNEGLLDILGITPGMQKSLGIGADTFKGIGGGLLLLVGGIVLIVAGGTIYKFLSKPERNE